MFKRKIETAIEEYLDSGLNESILIIDGARQVGKTSTIEYIGKNKFKNFISINFFEDKYNNKIFENVSSTNDFYFALGSLEQAKGKLNNEYPVLIFLDEIQEYPQFFTLLKFFKQDQKYKFICSGSLLGVSLRKTLSIPVGSMVIKHMYPMDFEEFLWANNIEESSIDEVHKCFKELKPLPDGVHNIYFNLFKKYLLVGGMPEVVKIFKETNNISLVRDKQTEIAETYAEDASKYDQEKTLKIKRIYNLIPSALENVKKRIKISDIDNKKSKFTKYLDEFDYLVSSGIATQVQSISNPVFPLIKSTTKNLIKFYLNDVGLLSNLYFKNVITPILNDECSINIGSIYECAVANELKAHGYTLYYFDNKQKGEVDFLIDDFNSLSVIPIEVKSGKNYYVHAALDNLINCKDYDIKRGLIFSNNKNVETRKNKIYLPIYYVMFLNISDVDTNKTKLN